MRPDRAIVWEIINPLQKKGKWFDTLDRVLENPGKRPHLSAMKSNQPVADVAPAASLATIQATLLRDAVMTAYSITGSLSAATVLCSSLVDEDVPEQHRAAAVLSRLHHIAMSRPKH